MKKQNNMIGKIIKRHIILLAIICLFMLFGKLTGIGCLFLLLFKLPCPTCGMTRAMLSLIRMDLQGYFTYNPMALPVCIAVWLMLNLDMIKHKKAVIIFSIVTVAANLLVYFGRMV